MSERFARQRALAVAGLVFVAAEVALRLYWIAGGRWAYTACDRTDLVDPTGGCGADRVETVPWQTGWGAVGAGVALAVVAVWALSTKAPRTGHAPAAWIAAALLLVVAFPLHLVFEIPAAIAGRPSDWRDLGARLALTTGGVLFALLANTLGPHRGDRVAAYRPVPRWTRRAAYVAVALPVVGWAVPHTLWVLGVPFGMSEEKLADAQRDLSTPSGVAIALVPPVFGLLVLGLVQRWGQQFPGWVPKLGRRAVPRMLAVIPAGTVAITLVAYGTLSAAVFVTSPGTDLRESWAVAGTLLVFLGWGVALGVTTVGYVLATRPERTTSSLSTPEIGEHGEDPPVRVVADR